MKNFYPLLLAAVIFAGGTLVYLEKKAREVQPIARDLVEFRTAHATHLTTAGPVPKAWQSDEPLVLPKGASEVEYTSDGLKLKAWLSAIPDDGKLHPAVVYCHGGFSFHNPDWAVAQTLIDAGYVVLAPRFRGENGNPGNFEYFYGEVDDVVAAGKFLASQKGIDTSRVFVVGHNAGADLAALAAMMPNPYALSVAIGAALDIRPLLQATDDAHKQLQVFDPSDENEVEARSAILYSASLRCPLELFHGDKDWGETIQRRFLVVASHFNKPASLTVVPGDNAKSLLTALPSVVRMLNDYHRGSSTEPTTAP